MTHAISQVSPFRMADKIIREMIVKTLPLPRTLRIQIIYLFGKNREVYVIFLENRQEQIMFYDEIFLMTSAELNEFVNRKRRAYYSSLKKF